MITERNAADIQAKIIVEGANGPISSQIRYSMKTASRLFSISSPTRVVVTVSTLSGCKTAAATTRDRGGDTRQNLSGIVQCL
ncbi:MAG: hypothetical protein R3B47_10010 [Bacteroidia bacterium]